MKKINQKPDITNIKNIIFDFGNVLLNINPELTAKAFRELGLRDETDFFGGRGSLELMLRFERGQATPDEFREGVASSMKHMVTNNQIDEAWNALLLDFPKARVELMRKLAKTHRIFLLSNSNQIHYDMFTSDFERNYGYPLESLFEKMWFSHQIGLSKPDSAIFEFVLKDKNLIPAETIFIDDTLLHVEAAQKTGIQALHLQSGTDVCDLLS
ncbi:MAG: HAD family phosphatase [Lentimicrobium sp.]|nr:HAD family phosphatase [Lentimicrobium sp.]